MSQPDIDLEGAPDDEYLDGKFDFLAARNLLYLEAELQLMEKELQEFDDNDKSIIKNASNDIEKERSTSAVRSWEDFKSQAMEGDERQARKLRMIYKLRRQMREYEDALIRRDKVLALEKPAKVPFDAFKDWFWSKKPLWCSGYDLLEEEEDMIVLGSPAQSDLMSLTIHRFLGYSLRKKRKTPKSWGRMYYYPNEQIEIIVATLSVLVSAALLVGAILALHFVKPIGTRLGIVGIFTVVFAASIMLLTSARRVEVYAATAAYAAVLVVFISVNT